LPQVQNHLSSLRGDQPQSGQRMRGGSDSLGFLSSSIWRSGTTTGLSATGDMHAIITRDLAANSKSWLIITGHQVPACRHIPLRCDTRHAVSSKVTLTLSSYTEFDERRASLTATFVRHNHQFEHSGI
jgi:hypothetical protein